VWLSPVEHCVRDAGVAGSNPATPTKEPPEITWLYASRFPTDSAGVQTGLQIQALS
jgi:hypothetical protein